MTYNREYTPEFIMVLKPNEIFVFGSNIHGYHGGGAAAIACRKFGAEWGVVFKLQKLFFILLLISLVVCALDYRLGTSA